MIKRQLNFIYQSMDGKMYFIMDEAEVSHKNLVALIVLINERGEQNYLFLFSNH